MTRLTEEFILSKARARGLENVRNLNLWGSNISDVSLIKRCHKAEIVIGTHNEISTLEPFGHLPRLQELYLRKNKVVELEEILYLKGLRNLSVLWLIDNPVALENPEYYRKFVIAHLGRLIKLDNQEVTHEERAAAEEEFRPKLQIPVPSLKVDNAQPRRNSGKPPAVPSPPGPGPRESPRGSERSEGCHFRRDANGLMVPLSPRTAGFIVNCGDPKSGGLLFSVMTLLPQLDLDAMMVLKTEVDKAIRLGAVEGENN